MRRILEITADVLDNSATGVAVTIIIAAIGVPQIASIGEINGEFIKSILIYVGLIVAVLIMLRLAGEGLLWINEQLPPNIQIVALPYHESIRDKEQNCNDEYLLCEIRNKENKELTDCYAVLRGVYVAAPQFGLVDITTWMYTKSANKKLKWKNTNKCETRIGPRTGKEELRVYKFRVDHKTQDYSVSDFNICEDGYRWSKAGGKEFFFCFELYGKIDGEDFSPVTFYGCITIEFEKTEKGLSYGFGINPVEKRVFYMADSKQGKQGAKKQKESGQTITKKEFLEALKKASKKQPSSPSKGKSKTSE